MYFDCTINQVKMANGFEGSDINSASVLSTSITAVWTVYIYLVTSKLVLFLWQLPHTDKKNRIYSWSHGLTALYKPVTLR